MERNRFSNPVGFIDLLFLTLLGFVFLFIMAFIMMNPPIKQEIDPKADIIVMMDWEDKSPHDIDLWCKLPGNARRAVNYSNPKIGLVHLDRDDRGIANDMIEMDNGEIVINHRNHEVMSWRGLPPGTYTVAGHFYQRGVEFDKFGVSDGEYIMGPATLRLQLIKLNPEYQLLKEVEIVLNTIGEEKTAFSFTITKDGDITNVNTADVPFVNDFFKYRSLNPRILQEGAMR